MSILAVSMPRVVRGLSLGAVLAVAAITLVAIPNRAQAQQTSAEFSEKYNAGATAYKARNLSEAAKEAKEAKAVAKTAYEKQAALKLMVAVSGASGNYADLSDALEGLLATDGVSAAEKVTFHKTLAQAYGQLKRVDKSIAEWKEYIKASGGTPADWDNLANLYGATKDCPNALQALEKAKAGKAANESQLKIEQSCYYKKDNDKYLAVTEEMVHRFPSKLSYTQVLGAYQDKKLDELAMLAVLRYGFEHDYLDDEAYFLKYADYALDVGATAEAQKVIEKGLAKKVVKAGDKSDRLLKQAKDRAAEDAKTLSQADAEARAGKNGESDAHLGLRYYNVGQYDKAVEALNRALSADRVARIKRPDDAKMVLGIAYSKLKKKAEADKAFNDAKSDPRMTAAARLWLGA
jgi:tetratricopeptide (TPR) repeat protein